MPGKDSSEYSGGPKKTQGILIALEDPVKGELLGRFLKKEGYFFELVDSWEGVREKIRFFQPEAVIQGNQGDFAPEKNRVDEIRHLTGLENLPVLLISAKLENTDPNTFHLKDPLDWEELGKTLDHLIRSKRGRNALLINTDALFNSVLAQQFERVGWRTFLVPHVQSAKSKISQETPDLIFMETQPGVNEILSILEALPDVPLFLLATRKLKGEDEKRLAVFKPVVFKPGQFSLKELKEALDSQIC